MKPFVVLAGFSLDFVDIFDDPFPDVQKWLEIVGNGQKSGSGTAKGSKRRPGRPPRAGNRPKIATDLPERLGGVCLGGVWVPLTNWTEGNGPRGLGP